MMIREYVSDDYGELVDLWMRSGLEFRPQGRDSGVEHR